MQQLETFNADVTHELRTPLTNLIGQTQVALSRERSAPSSSRCCSPTSRIWSGCGRSSTTCCSWPAPTRASARNTCCLPRSPPKCDKTVEFLDFLLTRQTSACGWKATPRRRSSSLVQPRRDQPAAQRDPPFAGGFGDRGRGRRRRGPASVTVSNTGAEIPLRAPGAPVRPLLPRRSGADQQRGEPRAGLAIVKAVAAMHAGSVSAASRGGVTAVGFSVAIAA